MMASGEIRLSGTMMRRMPVLAQSPDQTNCPKGTLANIGNDLVNNGKSLAKFGSSATQAGGVLIVGGAMASIAGAPEVGVPAIAAGGTAAATGGLFTYAGIGLELGGGLILNYYGNSQPLRSAGFQAAAEVAKAGVNGVFDHMMDLPLPDPFDPLVEKVSGESKCH